MVRIKIWIGVGVTFGWGALKLFLMECASRNPEMGVLTADYNLQSQNIGSLELQKH